MSRESSELPEAGSTNPDPVSSRGRDEEAVAPASQDGGTGAAPLEISLFVSQHGDGPLKADAPTVLATPWRCATLPTPTRTATV